MKIYTVKATMKLLGVSRNTVMGLLESKKLKSVRAGSRWIITESAIKTFLEIA